MFCECCSLITVRFWVYGTRINARSMKWATSSCMKPSTHFEAQVFNSLFHGSYPPISQSMHPLHPSSNTIIDVIVSFFGWLKGGPKEAQFNQSLIVAMPNWRPSLPRVRKSSSLAWWRQVPLFNLHIHVYRISTTLLVRYYSCKRKRGGRIPFGSYTLC